LARIGFTVAGQGVKVGVFFLRGNKDRSLGVKAGSAKKNRSSDDSSCRKDVQSPGDEKTLID
jgi:hypothetical protein